MPVINPGMAIGAWWYWGTYDKAARALGVGVKTFGRLVEGERIRDAEQDKINAAWRKLSPDAHYAVNQGGDFVRALSPDQAEVLKYGRAGQPPFKGKRFAKAVRAFIRDRTKIPRGVGDYLDEFYEISR